MAKCSYCGRNVSPEARRCPGCGQPDPVDEGVDWGLILGYLVMGGIGFYVAVTVLSVWGGAILLIIIFLWLSGLLR